MMMMMSYIYRWGRLLSLGTDAVVLPPQSWHKSNLVLLSSGMFPLFVQCVNVPTWRLFIHIWRCVFFNEDLCGWAHTCNLPVRGCVHVVSLLCGRKSFLENVLQLHGWRNHFTGRNTLQTRLLVRKCWVDSLTHTHCLGHVNSSSSRHRTKGVCENQTLVPTSGLWHVGTCFSSAASPSYHLFFQMVTFTRPDHEILYEKLMQRELSASLRFCPVVICLTHIPKTFHSDRFSWTRGPLAPPFSLPVPDCWTANASIHS